MCFFVVILHPTVEYAIYYSKRGKRQLLVCIYFSAVIAFEVASIQGFVYKKCFNIFRVFFMVFGDKK